MKTKKHLLATCAAFSIATHTVATAADLYFDGGTGGTLRTWNSSTAWNPDGFIATGDDLFIGTGTLGGGQTTLYSTSTYMALSSVASAYVVTPRSVTFDNSLGQFPAGGVDLRNSSAVTAQAGTLRFETADVDAITVKGGTAPAVTIQSRSSSAAMLIDLDFTGRVNFNVSDGGTLTLNGTNAATGGLINGTGGIRKTGNGTMVLIGTNSFQGGLEITSGVVSTSSNLNLSGGASPNPAAVIINGGTLRYTNSSVISNLVNRGFQVGENTGTIELTNGNLRMQSSIGDVPSQAGILRLTGSAILSIEAGTTHTGGTLLQGGQISLANGGTLGGAGGAGLSASTGTVFRGSGTVHGDSSFAAGSTLRVDEMSSTTGVTNPVATLSFADNLTIGDASLVFDLLQPGDSDLITVGGTLDIGTGTLDFDSFAFTALSGFGAGTYTLFTSTEPIVGSLGSNLSGLVDGLDATLSFGTGGTSLVLDVIPEPRAALLGAFGLILLLGGRRRIGR